MRIVTSALAGVLALASAVRAEGAPKADPGATRLLSEARAARAEWEKFPGFRAALTINADGEQKKCTLVVSASGGVELEGMDKGLLQSQVSRQLRSLVSHRMASSRASATPCAFADGDTNHPLGRKITVLNDELHSSYRIRDRQIVEVNRTMPGARFTITVLENHVTPEKEFLPAHYVVNTWDTKTGALRSSVTHRNDWVRVKGFDLPKRLLVVTADAEGNLRARELTFSGHELLPRTSAGR